MAGRPVSSSIVIGGLNPVAIDALAVKTMGIDYRIIQTISQAGSCAKWTIMPKDGFDPSLPGLEPPQQQFCLPKGWVRS